MISDPELRDLALAEFTRLAPAKFNKGMAEHNPDGTRGLMRMSPEQLVECIEEEIIDQWHYVAAVKKQLADLRLENAELKARLELIKFDQNSTTAKTKAPKPLMVNGS
tara:strand:+ start:83 stop:406 length:324 start_codon:yes stop_codon:yes gene_type:complete